MSTPDWYRLCFKEFPNAKPDVLKFLIESKPEGAICLLQRLKTYKNVQPLSFPGRDVGGFIADPRLKESLTIAKAVQSCLNPSLIRKLPDITPEFETWLADSCRDDVLALSIYPFRNKGDKAIRETRFYDLFMCYSKEPNFKKFLLRAIGLDYIRALNTLHYLFSLEETFGVEDILFCELISDLDEQTGNLTNILKASDCEQHWNKFVELKCLTGYRLVPWPGFDINEQTKELAHGYGDEHHLFFTFEHWLAKATEGVTAKPIAYLSLRAWIEAGSWITAGSSSEGVLEVEFAGEIYNVKCRKNFILDAVSVQELLNHSESGEQVSKAFIKSELGKVRVAVCSDIGTYLLLSWFCYVTGSSYKHWKWTTRNEDGDEKLQRMLDMVAQMERGLFGMAWDFQGFEKQVKTYYMIAMLERFDRVGRSNVPIPVLSDWLRLKAIAIKGFYHSTMITPDGQHTFDVKDSLPSGTFVTSSTGDAVGLVAAEAALTLLELIGIPRIDDDGVRIQGDDASYVDLSVPKLQLVDWVLGAMNWKAATGKFGITSKRTEFLRVGITSEGCLGYLARSIPSLTQRKPWSDTPPTPLDAIESRMSAAMTCLRRGAKKDISDILLRIWTRKNKISYIAARIPRVNGGLGLGKPIEWKGAKVAKPDKLAELKVDFKTNIRREQIVSQGLEVNLHLNIEAAVAIAQKQIAPILVNDNIPKLREVIRKKWTDDLQKEKIRVWDTSPLLLIEKKLGAEPAVTDYGEFSHVDGLVDRFALFPIDKVDVQKIVAPKYLAALSKRKGNLTRRDREHWLKGDLPVYMAELNPLGTTKVTAFIAELIDPSLVPKNRLRDVWINANFRALKHIRRTRYIKALLW